MDFDFLPSATQQTNTQNSFDFSPSSLNFETQPLHSFDDISQPSDNFLNSFLAENSSPNPPSFSLDPTDFINPSHQSSLSSELNYPPPINSPSPLANFEAPVEEKKENSLKYFFSGPPPTSDLSNNNNDKNNSGIVFSAPSSSGSAYSSLSSDSFLAPSPLKEFEREHEQFLQERAEIEKQRHNELIAHAQDEIKKFNAEREERIQKLRDDNRGKGIVGMGKAPEDAKQAWLNLDNLIDWKTSKRDSKEDTSRIRSILITMKHV